MIKYLVLLSFCISLLSSSVSYGKYCNKNALRDTHILIDLYNIDKTFYGKMIKEINYTPNEYVSINAFNPKTNNIEKIYDFCYPKYTKSKINKIKENSSIIRLTATKVETMFEDQMFIKQLIINKLSNIQKRITNTKQGDFLLAVENYSKNVDDFGRIFIFTNRTFNKKSELNLKGSVLHLLQKKSPSKHQIIKNNSFFKDKFINYKGINSRLIQETSIDNHLKLMHKEFNIIVKNKKYKSKIDLIINKNEIINGWFEIKGVIKAPLKGFIKKDENFVNVKAVIANTKILRGNELRINDKLTLKFNESYLSGKYYNHSYIFNDNTNKYFEYKVVK